MDECFTTATNIHGTSSNLKSHSPPAIVFAGLACSVASLAIGLIIGLSALAGNNGFTLNQGMASDIAFHPDLMVFGVIGGLLVTEKLELMEKFTIAGKLRISRLTVLFLFSGVFIASLGILAGYGPARIAGLVLVVLTSLLFMYYMTSSRNPGMADIKKVFGAAVLALALSAAANISHFITDSTELSYLALLFPVIYVMAERMELGFVRGMKVSQIRIQAVFAWLSVILAFLSVELEFGLLPSILMGASIAFILALVLVSLAYDPTFRKLRNRSRLQSFMQKGILISYAWLFLGLALFILQIGRGHGFLDPAAHSIALGFIGTFIVAHSPIIFPLTLKKKAVQENVTLLPIVVITVATIMRIFGDLTVSILPFSNAISYASGYVIIIAILSFAYNLKRIMPASTALGEPSPA